MNWFKRKKENEINPLNLDWGIITADGDNRKEIIHVFNSDMTKKENEKFTKSFIINKYRYYKKHLPSEKNQIFTLDLRGQNITEKEIEKIESDLIAGIQKIDTNPNVKFEFKI